MSDAPRRAVPVDAWRPDRGNYPDKVAAEEPLEIRVDGVPIGLTLRTPGDDADLAAGFVVSEGLVSDPSDIDRVVVVEDVPPAARGNVVDVRLTPGASADIPALKRLARRPSFVTAACGVCGRGTLESLSRRLPPIPEDGTVDGMLLSKLPSRLREAQAVFAETGGLHAAGLFDFDGRLIVAREDVGRHNAVDKVVGFGVLARRLPFAGTVLMVSGRTGFEIVLKAWVAGIPVLASVSAPSQLAVGLAEEANMGLAGFVRDPGYAIYAGRHRIRSGE